MPNDAALGPKIRALRRHQHFSQAELARRLGISPSYLNLIEHNRRPCPAELLIKLAELVPIDLKLMSAANDGRTADDLLEVFGDALFENLEVLTDDVRDMAAAYPSAAQVVLRLYHAYRTSQESLQTLASRVLSDGDEIAGVQTGSRLPTEEVSDLIQRHLNYFPELEQGAEALTRDARLE